MIQNAGRSARPGRPRMTEPSVAETESFLATVQHNARHLDHRFQVALHLVTTVERAADYWRAGVELPTPLMNELEDRYEEWRNARWNPWTYRASVR